MATFIWFYKKNRNYFIFNSFSFSFYTYIDKCKKAHKVNYFHWVLFVAYRVAYGKMKLTSNIRLNIQK